jgi:hypothetical protein
MMCRCPLLSVHTHWPLPGRCTSVRVGCTALCKGSASAWSCQRGMTCCLFDQRAADHAMLLALSVALVLLSVCRCSAVAHSSQEAGAQAAEVPVQVLQPSRPSSSHSSPA